MQPDVRPVSGTRIKITRLRYVLLSLDRPNYVTAAEARIHPTTLSEYAQGKRDISAKHLRALCEALQCQPEEIMGEMWVEIA